MIYHITSRSDWEEAKRLGQYRAASLAAEGFIHCSAREQILSVANSVFVGQSDLLILCIDKKLLDCELIWEAPAHPDSPSLPETKPGERFPHIYSELNIAAVVAAIEFRESASGFALPPDLPT